MTVSIVGTGYVGLTTGTMLASAGNKVYCIDVDSKKIKTIAKGKSFFFEPNLEPFIKKEVKSGNLIPTTNYRDAIPHSDFAIICVGTPSKGDGSFDLSYIFEATESIAQHMKDGIVVIQKSTVPVGTGKKVQRILDKSGKKSNVVSCPEFLAEGSAIFDALNMDRVVVGSKSVMAKRKVLKLFKTVDDFSKQIDITKIKHFGKTYKKKVALFNDKPFEDRVVSVSLESAELIKVAANSFLTTKISFANSIARICDEVGADINEVMDGIGTDHRIGRAFLYSGLGWGGGCFPKDTAGLIYSADEVGFDFKLLRAVVDINNSQSLYISRKARAILGGKIEGKTVTVLGLSFKPGTSDIRISPSIKLVKNLVRYGAEVRVYDPEAMDEAQMEINSNVHFSKNVEDALNGTELAILATEWPEFLDIDFKKVKKLFKKKNILDARNRWSKEELVDLGYTYSGIGR